MGGCGRLGSQGRWLARGLQGHYNYYAVPDNSEALYGFRRRLIRLWLQALRRRSQKDRLTWKRMLGLEARWLPEPRIQHPWPNRRFDARTQGRSPVRLTRTLGLCGGPLATAVPTGAPGMISWSREERARLATALEPLAWFGRA